MTFALRRHPKVFANTAREQGVTLIEVLVALVAGLLLSTGLFQVFVSNKQSYRLQEAEARLQENARFAIETLQRDIRTAGFRGCASGANLDNVLNTATAYAFDFRNPIGGYEWTSNNVWTPSLDSSISGVAKKPENGTDVIMVRGPVGDSTKVVAPYMSSGGADIKVPANSSLQKCDIVMVADCESASFLQIMSDDIVTNGTLSHTAGANCTRTGVATPFAPGNAANSGTNNVLRKNYGIDAEVIEFATKTYWVSTNDSGNRALYRKIGTAASEELVEGVEDMEILYGEDTDGDNSPNRYLKANLVANWDRVLTARISLLMVSTDTSALTAPQTYTFDGTTTTPTDRALRRAFNMTLGIRNRLP